MYRDFCTDLHSIQVDDAWPSPSEESQGSASPCPLEGSGPAIASGLPRVSLCMCMLIKVHTHCPKVMHIFVYLQTCMYM